MKLEQTFEVQAPLEQVWEALIDLERVAPCLPGAAITGHDEDGTYRGTFTVKLGPMTAAYNGTIKIEDADEATHTATLKARGTDKRGQGGANATIVNTLSEHDGGTRVEAVTDFTITGRLAQFGRGGMMEDVSNRLLRDFATCLSTRLASRSRLPRRRARGAGRRRGARGGRRRRRRRVRRRPRHSRRRRAAQGRLAVLLGAVGADQGPFQARLKPVEFGAARVPRRTPDPVLTPPARGGKGRLERSGPRWCVAPVRRGGRSVSPAEPPLDQEQPR